MFNPHRSRDGVCETITAATVASLLVTLTAEAEPAAGALPTHVPAAKIQIEIPCAACASDGLYWNTSLVTAEVRSLHPEIEPAGGPEETPKLRLDTLPYRDQAPLINRLRKLQALSFLTLWDSSEATLYVGVNRKGMPGLHLRQKNGRGTLLSSRPPSTGTPAQPTQARARAPSPPAE